MPATAWAISGEMIDAGHLSPRRPSPSRSRSTAGVLAPRQQGETAMLTSSSSVGAETKQLEVYGRPRTLSPACEGPPPGSDVGEDAECPFPDQDKVPQDR